MKITITLAFVSLLAAGCRDMILVDTTPPSAPRGIQSLALDNEVQLSWLRNVENDVAGYNVWASDRYDGRYELIGTTGAAEFADTRALNGITYFYAVSAFDRARNESELSYEAVSETPRPEGFDILLYEANQIPAKSGYDFSSYSVGRFDDAYTDFFYEKTSQSHLLSVWSDTDVQDMGYTASFDDIREAPISGWTTTKSVEVIPGHTYVVWTWDNHFAKVRVSEVSSTRIVFSWAYQLDEGNRRLKGIGSGGVRAPLTR